MYLDNKNNVLGSRVPSLLFSSYFSIKNMLLCESCYAQSLLTTKNMLSNASYLTNYHWLLFMPGN